MDIDKKEEMQLCNFAALLCYVVLNEIFIVYHFVRYLNKIITLRYLAIFIFISFLPQLIAVYLFHRDTSSGYIKYIIIGGYMVFYNYMIFTTENNFDLVYAMIMGIIIICYNEYKLTIMYALLIIVSNIADMIFTFDSEAYRENGFMLMSKVCSFSLFIIFSMIATHIIKMNNNIKLKALEAEKERSQELNNELVAISERLLTDLDNVSGRLSRLVSSSEKVQKSMARVREGTGETSDSVLLQQNRTENISRIIQKISVSGEDISKIITEIRADLKKSAETIGYLKEISDDTLAQNGKITGEINNLTHHLKEVQQATDSIEDINTQTSILALNASIEAAKAGDAGHGFSLVASEISKLASRTQDATTNISNIILNLSSSSTRLSTLFKNIVEKVDDQANSAENFLKNIENMQDLVQKVYGSSEFLTESTNDLKASNEEIITGINRISAATEQVNRQTSEASEIINENTYITNDVEEIISGIDEMAGQIKDTGKEGQ